MAPDDKAPGQGQPFAITVLIDDVRGTKFLERLEAGELPNLKKYVFDRGSYTLNSLAGFPSSSSNGHTTLETGCWAGKSGVINAAYWDFPEKRAAPERMRIDDINLGALKLWDRIITAKTIFEYVPFSASYHIIKRGAQIRFFKITKLLKYIPLFVKLKRKGAEAFGTSSTDLYQQILEDQLSKTLKKLAKQDPPVMPDVSFVLLLPSDLAAHYHGFDSLEFLNSLKLADLLVDIFVHGYDDDGTHLPGLEELGLMDRVVWAFFSDHASKKFDASRAFDVVSYLRETWSGATMFALNPPPGVKAKKQPLETWEVLFMESAEFFGIFFKDPATGGRVETVTLDQVRACPWNEAMRGRDLVEDFFGIPAVNWVVLREEPDRLRFLTREGQAVCRRADPGPRRRYAYTIVEGADPFGYQDTTRIKPLVDGEFHDHLDWLAATHDHAIPDLFEHLFGFLDHPNAPPLVLIAAREPVFYNPDNPKDQPELKVNQHDGIFREEKTTPFLLAGPGIPAGREISHCRNVDVMPTILHAIGHDADPTEIDGRVVTEFFEKE